MFIGIDQDQERKKNEKRMKKERKKTTETSEKKGETPQSLAQWRR